MAPCLWDLDVGCCQATWDSADAALKTRATQYATTVLWGLTGRRFGPCAVTVRPCVAQSTSTWQTYGVLYDSGEFAAPYRPFIWDGVWRNCGCGSTCGCQIDPVSQIWLPGPVAGISEVRVDGVVVTSSAYRVDDGQWLVRTDGQAWPLLQDLNAVAGAADTFTVTYLRGELVPDGGQAAAGTLACEYIKACQGQPCRFPKRVTSVSRQGVSVSAEETVRQGGTGVPEVDAWVQAFNPGKLTQRPAAYSPDLPLPRVTTWTG